MSMLHDARPDTSDPELRHAAIERIEARRGFWTHLSVYVLINTVLIVTWFTVAGEGLFWPVFPLAAWGIGLVFHAADVFARPPSEDRVRREMQRLDDHTVGGDRS